MSGFDLRALLEALNEGDVRFVVIGGVAVGAHGYIRATEDLDLVPEADPANLELLTKVLESLGATLPTAGGRRFEAERDGAALSRGANLTADTRLGGLDVLQRTPGVQPYPVLARDAVESELFGVPVRICSLARLREMKQARGETQDKADLENLPEGP